MLYTVKNSMPEGINKASSFVAINVSIVCAIAVPVFIENIFSGFFGSGLPGSFCGFPLSFPANVFIVYFIVLIFCFNDKIITKLFFDKKNPHHVSGGGCFDFSVFLSLVLPSSSYEGLFLRFLFRNLPLTNNLTIIKDKYCAMIF